MKRRRNVAALLASVAVLSLASAGGTPASAQSTAAADFQQLYDELLRNPTNLDLNERFAGAAEARGDLEAAVGALERVLDIDPDQPKVRLRVGELYLRLGSAAMAQGYLAPLAASAAAPADVRAAARHELREAGATPSPHHFSMTFFAGAQWQTNPAAAPGSPVFLAGGVATPVIPSAAKRSDSNVFGEADAEYSYDLDTDFGDRLVIDGRGYGASYRRLHQLDTALGDVTAGPLLSTERIGIAGGQVRPYAVLGAVRLGGAPYDESFGGGIAYGQEFGKGLPHLDLGYEARQGNYHATQNYPSASLLSGRLDHVEVALSQPIGAIALAAVDAVYNRQNTRFSGFSNDDYAVGASLSIGYAASFLPSGLPAVTSLSAQRHYIAYDAPDPGVSATIKRADHLWRLSLGEVVPVTRALAVAAVLQRDINGSNIGNFSYTNTSFLVGPRLSF